MMNKNVSIRDHHLGKYIYRYYKKEACKILELFENINKNADEKNIHQFRVAIKKLRAVFHLLEMLYPFKFISKDHYKIIKPIFKIAGKIREDQINHSIIKKYNLPTEAANQYSNCLIKGEHKSEIQFKNAIRNFDYKIFEKTKLLIKELCNEVNNQETINECHILINTETKLIEQILVANNNPIVFHSIRMRLKSIGEIVYILYHFDHHKEFEDSLKDIKQIGKLLGNWHDKIMLEKSIEYFFTKGNNLKAKNLFPIIEMLDMIRKENQQFLVGMNEKINSIINALQKMKYS